MAKSSPVYYVFTACILFVISSVYCQRVNVTVALDGTGDFNSIGAAIQNVPNNADIWYFIHVKEGIYKENVFVPYGKRNIVVFGDGMGKTIITYNKSNRTGFNTAASATMDITSTQFLLKDISIINSAGPEGGQAVALRTAGDYISCYRCSIEGYQDTLFVAYGRQFFYECKIYGTVDFIFGDASVVLQNSFLYARKPSEHQTNEITAQGRADADRNTGIVIHNCTITAAPDLVPYKLKVKTYLGRPWKEYSRTIIMESCLHDIIDRKGWNEFNGSFALSTLYYAEYANRGPGASTNGRVNWPGYHVVTSPNEVQSFTVQNFIDGKNWLPKLGVPFVPGFIGKAHPNC